MKYDKGHASPPTHTHTLLTISPRHGRLRMTRMKKGGWREGGRTGGQAPVQAAVGTLRSSSRRAAAAQEMITFLLCGETLAVLRCLPCARQGSHTALQSNGHNRPKPDSTSLELTCQQL